jgi:hypothetical protein
LSAWNCRQKDNDTGEQCNQLIFKAEYEFHPSGRPKIKNFEDGPGGNRGEDHVCPYRSGGEFDRSEIPDWSEYYRLQEFKFCVTCAVKFSTKIFCLCPNCFKLRCRECLRKRLYGQDDIRCPSCLCLQCDVIETKAKNDELIERLRPKGEEND